MEVHAKLNSKAFTLIELLVSMVIILIVFLALAKSLIFYTHNNVRTSLRNEAVKIAQDCLEEMRAGQSCSDNVTAQYRNYSVIFTINSPKISSLASGTANNVTISVSYSYLNNNFSYNLKTVVYKQ